MDDSDDDTPQLSAHAMAALQEFYQDQTRKAEELHAAMAGDNVDKFSPEENWQLSQFWYDEATADRLAKEALSIAGDCGRIVCVSSPTAYRRIRELKGDSVKAYCLEFDDRFKVFGEDFVFYDYKGPLKLPEEFKNSFDIVIADPPFLSEECLCKTAVTIRYLMKDKVILCTGAVMTELADKLLGVKPMKFLPRHSNGLQNDFLCFTNYDSVLLGTND